MVVRSVMKMAEIWIFVRSLAVGFLVAEVGRLAFYLGANFAPALSSVPIWVNAASMIACIALCVIYASRRGAFSTAGRMARSFRIDLLAAVAVGVWANGLASHWLIKAHSTFKSADPQWAPMILVLLCAVLLSPLVQWRLSKLNNSVSQLYFVADEEIGTMQDDLLSSDNQVKAFAETVLESGAHSGLVFGVDGPWGVGKTSFINLAEHYWAQADDRVIVCRFEPLRYASESDLADRMIRDLSASIQRQVFAPEFRPAASRYSRLIKGRADISFLGFKISLEPGQESVEDLLDDINEVLKRIGRRVIVVIDDLDRLDAKTTNSILFATRRTFRITQATYVLCYDTEILAKGKDDGSRAREFLEKFVSVKLSLFVDSSRIRDFLRRDWQREDNRLGAIPSDTMLKLGAVLNELAEILDSELATKYLPIIGDIRKVKRFVNSMLLMQIEKSDLGRTDFNKRDLVNLILLNLNFPGLFRRIYAEETEGRCGTFSVRREYKSPEYKNTEEFSSVVDEYPGAPGFLLGQLFDVNVLKLKGLGDSDEAVLASRACFNQRSFRNLEGYLKLIVRFATPEPRETFILYQKAVKAVEAGSSIDSVLSASEFKMEFGEYAHDQFWRVLVNQSYGFSPAVADDAINTLIDYLPRYSSIEIADRGLRPRSVYSLLRLLDRAGWGAVSGMRRDNSPKKIAEIAWRIFGEEKHKDNGILLRIADQKRGVLGWNDLMLFRLHCSADRQGQLYNLQSSLILNQDEASATTGNVQELAIAGMRKISQVVFGMFKREYIDPRLNFYSEVDRVLDKELLGDASEHIVAKISGRIEVEPDAPSLFFMGSSMRGIIKSFVIYQLCNSLLPSGSGVGCGHYDESGSADRAGIARMMNEYVFEVCFNPEVEEDNVFHFLDHCLSHLTSSFFSGRDEEGYFATRAEMLGGFDPEFVRFYWRAHRDLIRQKALQANDRTVVTSNYIATYGESVQGVFDVLDALCCEANAEDPDDLNSADSQM